MYHYIGCREFPLGFDYDFSHVTRWFLDGFSWLIVPYHFQWSLTSPLTSYLTSSTQIAYILWMLDRTCVKATVTAHLPSIISAKLHSVLPFWTITKETKWQIIDNGIYVWVNCHFRLKASKISKPEIKNQVNYCFPSISHSEFEIMTPDILRNKMIFSDFENLGFRHSTTKLVGKTFKIALFFA